MKRSGPYKETNSIEERPRKIRSTGKNLNKFTGLPDEMMGHILGYLRMGEIFSSFWLVCKSLYQRRNDMLIEANEELSVTQALSAMKSGMKIDLRKINVRRCDLIALRKLLDSNLIKRVETIRIELSTDVVDTIIALGEKIPTAELVRINFQLCKHSVWVSEKISRILLTPIAKNVKVIDMPYWTNNKVYDAIQNSDYCKSLQSIRIKYMDHSDSEELVRDDKIELNLHTLNFDSSVKMDQFEKEPHNGYRLCKEIDFNVRNPNPSLFNKDGKLFFPLVEKVHLSNSEMDLKLLETISNPEILPALTYLTLRENSIEDPSDDGPFSVSCILSNDPRSIRLKGLTFGSINDSDIGSITESPYLSNLTELNILDNDVEASTLEKISKSKYIKHLKQVALLKEPRPSQPLSSLNNFQSIQSLELHRCEWGRELIRLLSNGCVENLTSLRMLSSDIQDIEPIASSSAFSKLTDLNLSCNKLDDNALTLLSKSREITKLEYLILSNNLITDVSAMSNSENFLNIKNLSLHNNRIGDTAIELTNVRMPKLSYLDISHNPIPKITLSDMNCSPMIENISKNGVFVIDKRV